MESIKFLCQTDTSNKNSFSVSSKVFAIKVIGSAKLVQNLVKILQISALHIQLSSTVVLSKMNGFSFSGQRTDQNLQIEENLNLKSKIANSNFYTSPSDTSKHSLETAKPCRFWLTHNKLIVQLSKFIWWIYNSELSWLCAMFYFVLKYRLSVGHFLF